MAMWEGSCQNVFVFWWKMSSLWRRWIWKSAVLKKTNPKMQAVGWQWEAWHSCSARDQVSGLRETHAPLGNAELVRTLSSENFLTCWCCLSCSPNHWTALLMRMDAESWHSYRWKKTCCAHPLRRELEFLHPHPGGCKVDHVILVFHSCYLDGSNESLEC